MHAQYTAPPPGLASRACLTLECGSCPSPQAMALALRQWLTRRRTHDVARGGTRRCCVQATWTPSPKCAVAGVLARAVATGSVTTLRVVGDIRVRNDRGAGASSTQSRAVCTCCACGGPVWQPRCREGGAGPATVATWMHTPTVAPHCGSEQWVQNYLRFPTYLCCCPCQGPFKHCKCWQQFAATAQRGRMADQVSARAATGRREP